MVGCVVTRDRLAVANLEPDSACRRRLCASAKESLPHLVRSCPIVTLSVADFDQNRIVTHVWTDGSVLWPKMLDMLLLRIQSLSWQVEEFATGPRTATLLSSGHSLWPLPEPLGLS